MEIENTVQIIHQPTFEIRTFMKNKRIFFSTEITNTGKFCDQGKFRHSKSFPIFLIEEKFIYFRDFLYDLEIGESFKNATRNTTIRLQKLRLKSYPFFSRMSGSARIPKVGW